MKLALASDHAGRILRREIKAHLSKQQIEFVDFGVPDEVEKADYPNLALAVAQAVVNKEYDLGILICGTGTGMTMTANKVKNCRAANCVNEFMAAMARAHNNANVLALGERVVGTGLALAIVDVFLKTEFEGGRHQARLDLMP